MSQSRTGRLGVAAASAVLMSVLGCSTSRPPPRYSITETTALTVPTPSPGEVEAARNARLARERDEARLAVESERNRRNVEMRARHERNDFEGRLRAQLDDIDEELRRMKDKVAHGSASARLRVDELWDERDDIERRLKRVHTESAETWKRFTSELEAQVEDLKSKVESARVP